MSVEKVETGGDLKRNEGEELMDLDEEMEVKVEYRVKSIIKKKIIFKNRPKTNHRQPSQASLKATRIPDAVEQQFLTLQSPGRTTNFCVTL